MTIFCYKTGISIQDIEDIDNRRQALQRAVQEGHLEEVERLLKELMELKEKIEAAKKSCVA